VTPDCAMVDQRGSVTAPVWPWAAHARDLLGGHRSSRYPQSVCQTGQFPQANARTLVVHRGRLSDDRNERSTRSNGRGLRGLEAVNMLPMQIISMPISLPMPCICFNRRMLDLLGRQSISISSSARKISRLVKSGSSAEGRFNRASSCHSKRSLCHEPF
jgi:hypothetical protein